MFSEVGSRDDPNDFVQRFESAFARLQVEVLGACGSEDEWPASVAAGIYAALEFATRMPAAARVLTVEAPTEAAAGGRRYVRMIAHFADLLSAGAPAGGDRPDSTARALVGAIAAAVADQLRGRGEEPPIKAGPELIAFTLLPYLGREAAQHWATATARPGR